MAEKRRQTRLPLVAIVGRPNVGKSTLFNRVTGADKAIVEPTAGVTRDRIYADVRWKGANFSVVDTAGLSPGVKKEGAETAGAREQAEIAVAEADLILMLVSGIENPVPYDREIVRILRKSGKTVFCLVNKIDHAKHEKFVDNFHSFGELKTMAISALHGRNIYELLDEIAAAVPHSERPQTDEHAEPPLRIAILGKPNVGKSTLVNTFLGRPRMLTSSIPGTTRDSVDTAFEYRGHRYVATDTAGVRRKAKVENRLERLATLRAIRSISACDVAVLMIDASEGPSRQDTRLAALMENRGKAAVIALNKWDLAPEEARDAKDVEEKTFEKLGGALYFSSVVKISAARGKNVHRLFSCVRKAHLCHNKKVSTKKLNNFLQEAVSKGPSIFKGREFKAYYISQVGSAPPGFVIFTNSAGEEIPAHYSRYIERGIRSEFGFEGTPIRLFFRKRERKAE